MGPEPEINDYNPYFAKAADKLRRNDMEASKGLALYEISRHYLEALEALTDPESDIPDEAICDTLEGIEGELKDKSIAVAQFTKNLEAVADSIRVAELHMERRRKAIEKRAQALRDYMKFWMEQSGITRIESPWFVLSVVKNPPGITVLDEALIPSEHKEIVTTIKLNKLSIKRAIQSGQDVPGARLESGTRLSIK